jgi:hypothetical protein
MVGVRLDRAKVRGMKKLAIDRDETLTAFIVAAIDAAMATGIETQASGGSRRAR